MPRADAERGCRADQSALGDVDRLGCGLDLRSQLQPKVAERAGALVREQLKHGARPESVLMTAAEAADISERTLVVAADGLGVRTHRGQWWLPTAPAFP